MSILSKLVIPPEYRFWTRRPDGDPIPRPHAYRHMMQYIMPERNGSVVFFDSYVNAEELVRYVPLAKDKLGADITQCVIGAIATVSKHNPAMNQFSVGSRVYQRHDWEISFSVKRKRMNKKAKLAAIKLKVDQQETFAAMCDRIDRQVNHQRSGDKTSHDKEYALLTSIPRPLLRFGCAGVRWLDDHNLLPKKFIDSDPMYCTMFVANLGSLNMGAGYHHLYEWGTCPLFMMIGKIEERPVVKDGKVIPQKTLHIRYSYDERIDDGLTARFGIEDVQRVLESPFELLGCLAEDGSDARPFGQVNLRDSNDSELSKLEAIAEADRGMAEGERAGELLVPATKPAGNGKGLGPRA